MKMTPRLDVWRGARGASGGNKLINATLIRLCGELNQATVLIACIFTVPVSHR